MLAFNYRFHGHGSLRYVYKNGTAKRSRLITVKVARNTRRKFSRFSVVISKKVHKSAVGRNRARRRIYAIIQDEIPRMPHVYDVAVIVSSSEVVTVSSDELKSQIVQLFEQSGLYDHP